MCAIPTVGTETAPYPQEECEGDMLWGGTETEPYPEVPVAEWEYDTPWGVMETTP